MKFQVERISNSVLLIIMNEAGCLKSSIRKAFGGRVSVSTMTGAKHTTSTYRAIVTLNFLRRFELRQNGFCEDFAKLNAFG